MHLNTNRLAAGDKVDLLISYLVKYLIIAVTTCKHSSTVHNVAQKLDFNHKSWQTLLTTAAQHPVSRGLLAWTCIWINKERCYVLVICISTQMYTQIMSLTLIARTVFLHNTPSNLYNKEGNNDTMVFGITNLRCAYDITTLAILQQNVIQFQKYDTERRGL